MHMLSDNTTTVHAINNIHCNKSDLCHSIISEFFSRIWTEHGDLQNKFPYSLRMWRNTGQTNPECKHFSRS